MDSAAIDSVVVSK